MNITLSIDELIVKRARERLRAMGKSVNEEIRDHLRQIAGGDDVEKDIEFLRRTAGQGNPNGWKWNRDELYEERLKWPRTPASPQANPEPSSTPISSSTETTTKSRSKENAA